MNKAEVFAYLYDRHMSETDNSQSQHDWLLRCIEVAKKGDLLDLQFYCDSTDLALECAIEVERKILSL